MSIRKRALTVRRERQGAPSNRRRVRVVPWRACTASVLTLLCSAIAAVPVRSSDTGAERALLSLRATCLALAQNPGATPRECQSAVYAAAEAVWHQYPQPDTESRFIDIVTGLRRDLPPKAEKQYILSGLVQLLCQFGEDRFLGYCSNVYMHEGLAALYRMVPGSSFAAPGPGVTPEEQESRFAEFTRLVRENIAMRKRLAAMLRNRPPQGLIVADPLTKGLVHLDAAATSRFLGLLLPTGFVGTGPDRLRRGREPGVGDNGDMPLVPRDGFPFCPFGQVQGEDPLCIWFSYPANPGFSSESTCLDLAFVCFPPSDVVRAVPVAPDAREVLTGKGLVARRPVDLAWWLASGGGSLRASISRQEMTLLPWEDIARPLRDILLPAQGPGTGTDLDLDFR